MFRPWVAAAAAASLIAFAASYAIAQPGAGEPPAPKPLRHLTLDPGPAPDGWQRARIPGSPAVLAYPPNWQAISGDRGTASAALRSGGRIIGYLNATPQGGAETVANWLRFRPDHNRHEGDTGVTPQAGVRGLRFRTGHGSCLVDSYSTGAGARYREIACIVAGRKATTVVVASATPAHWQSLAPVLRRAVSSFTT
jgi:hypothetical protein